MKTLFIGRFQPFHQGHLHDIKDALCFSDFVIIGVGSSQDSKTEDNPFSYEERQKMISSTLDAIGIIDYEIVAIPDIHKDEAWVEHVQDIIPDFDCVLTGNPKTKRLFEEKDIIVRNVVMFEDITATKIREAMGNGGKWNSLVPEQVKPFVEKHLASLS